jgi:deazaflavin-dependent oxidoreductase (nitroreductase family)
MELIWRIHPWIYRISGGRILGSMGSVPILLLTTTGRKSGRARATPLIYLAEGKSYVVAASYAGEPRHPAWFLNLVKNPDAEVQVRSSVVPVHAREAKGAERERLWAAIVAQDDSFVEYQRRTTREIPVVVLEPRTPA